MGKVTGFMEFDRHERPYKAVEERLKNFREFVIPLDEAELALIRLMAAWPRMVETAAQMHEPHRIAFYSHDLASAFHGLWNKGNDNPELRFIVSGRKDVTLARLALIRAIKQVIASALEILGVEALQEMR